MSEAEKRRKILEAVVSISMDSLAEDKSKEAEDIDFQLQADWEDIGGVGNNITPEQVE